MKNSALRKLLTLFAGAVIVSVVVYVIVGLIIQQVDNSYINTSVPLDLLREHFAERDRITQPLDFFRFCAPLPIFSLFALLAAGSIFRLTKSTFLRVFLLIVFAGFPIILLFMILLFIILTGRANFIF